MKLIPLVLMSVVLAATPSQDRPNRHEATQLGMNAAAGKELQAIDAEMAGVLDKLLTKAAGRAEPIAKLNKAQAAWTTYRDAQVEAMWPFPERQAYGSAYPMCVADARTSLTKMRVTELRAMLERVEGNVCNSQWPE